MHACNPSIWEAGGWKFKFILRATQLSLMLALATEDPAKTSKQNKNKQNNNKFLKSQLGVVTHTFNPSTKEAEADRPLCLMSA